MGHTIPHPPQFSVSRARSTHRPAQAIWRGGQATHTPDVHTFPDAQTVPQVPQLFESVCRFVQVVPQRASPTGQVATQ